MTDSDIAFPAILSLAVTWPICWALVYKAGWRHTDWLGLTRQPYGDSESFLFYLLFSNMLLALLGAPILALRRSARRGGANAPTTKAAE